MTQSFKRILVYGRARRKNSLVPTSLQSLLTFLEKRQSHEIYLESQTSGLVEGNQYEVLEKEAIARQCDLIIVVGGDGSLLNASRLAVDAGVPIVGINRGRLGFLTDISPNHLDTQLAEVLDGHYSKESRFLLDTSINDSKGTSQDMALNDVVLLPGDNEAHMIEFSIHVDQAQVCALRADGLIVSTPTGSTAYALSGGGPILHPSLNAVGLVPMFPHTLSNRPIVVDADATITIQTSENNPYPSYISVDGQTKTPIEPGGTLQLKKKPNALSLIHPTNYDYYHTLREKLGWQQIP